MYVYPDVNLSCAVITAKSKGIARQNLSMIEASGIMD